MAEHKAGELENITRNHIRFTVRHSLLDILPAVLAAAPTGNRDGDALTSRGRYSEEFRYRPAASPVITEYLKDGRIRLRGASPGGIGVREEDMPKTPAQKAAEEKKRMKEARKAAKEKLGLNSKRAWARKTRANGRKNEV